MENHLHTISESEMIAGLYTAIIALAERITGETLTVYIPTQNGERAVTAGRVRWSSTDLQAVANLSDRAPCPTRY
jgi:hypothetical protein